MKKYNLSVSENSEILLTIHCDINTALDCELSTAWFAGEPVNCPAYGNFQYVLGESGVFSTLSLLNGLGFEEY